MDEQPRNCVRCTQHYPATMFHWQVGEVEGRRVKKRDKTCKPCRAWQKRERDRTRPALASDSLIDRFLRLPVPR